MSGVSQSHIAPHGAAVYIAEHLGDEIAAIRVRVTGAAHHLDLPERLQLETPPGVAYSDDILHAAAHALFQHLVPVEDLPIDIIIVPAACRADVENLTPFQIETLRGIAAYHINYMQISAEADQFCATISGAVSPIAIFFEMATAMGRILSPRAVISNNPGLDRMQKGSEHAPWHFVPIDLVFEWVGTVDADVISSSIDGFIAGCDAAGRTDDPAVAAYARVSDWFWQELSPSLADPFTDQIMDLTQAAAAKAPLKFAAGNESEVVSLIRDAVAIDFTASDDEVDYAQAEWDHEGVSFGNILTPGPRQLQEIVMRGAWRGRPASITNEFVMSMRGKTILNEILCWASPRGQAIAKYDGNRLSSAVIGPAKRFHQIHADDIGSAHELLDAVQRITAFLAMRGYSEDEIAALVSAPA